jgi:hypothetical protein
MIYFREVYRYSAEDRWEKGAKKEALTGEWQYGRH